MFYASHAARNLLTAIAKENGRETRHYVHTVAENCPMKEMMNCLQKLLNRITDKFHRGRRQFCALQGAIQDREGLE